MNYYALVVTTIAGLSTVVGGLIIYYKVHNKNQIITNALAFAAGVMITTSIIDLIPNAYSIYTNNYSIFPRIIICLIGINIGVIISTLINKYLPDDNIAQYDGKLYRVGVFSMIAIIVHNIPEGIATYLTTSNNISLGVTLSIAIALHNIPEGISIALPIYYGSNSKLKALFYTFFSGISELLGAIMAEIFLAPLITNNILAFLYLIIAGMMVYIPINSLIPTSKKYNNGVYNLKYILIGSLIMILNHILFN